MNRLRVGDRVVVISGKDKGKEGRISKVLTEEGKVVVEGINVVTRHERPSPRNPQGGKVQKELALWASKVMPVDPQTGKPTRVKIEERDGKKVRVAKSGAVLQAES
jgi:large subunit ribosomal protein L24